MSIDHHERVKGVVKAALKEAALSEPFGFVVAPPAMWPVMNEQGQQVHVNPGWFIVVTIRGAGLGEPDIGNGFPVYGILPSDVDFQNVARALLEKCRKERDATNANALAAAGPSMKLSEKPK